ncbi:hypothetical protein GOP47_0005291 [Adiantum capillus-veneris]|uniref:Uncharacterized protein n=1 Tax=Adiantum capillus-veneris TaxID=13818 RepID=A0A9D4V6H0_ADICA|nr:hypothetical protein GOP47_0005291 [Adiantum capillus-veneris]
MATCYHVLSVSSRNVMSACLEHLAASNDRTHSSLLCAPSSSSFSPYNLPESEAPLRRTVFRAGQSKSETLTTPSPPSSRKTKARPSKKQAKEEGLLFEDTTDFEFEHGYTMRQVCDRLIDIFTQEKTSEVEWRKLLLLGDDWDRIKPYFFKRCNYKASLETNKLKKANLLSFCSKVKKVDAEMEKCKQLFDYVKDNWPELDVVVAGRRKEFTNAFFQHMTLLCEASSNRLDRRDDLARIAAKCLAAVEAHDRALEDVVAVTIAQQKFDKILDASSLDEACSKLDKLAEKKQLDSTLMLLFAKAWAAAKDSNTMTDEIKDLMHHLYMVARGHLQRLIPKEIRILQDILACEDPTSRFKALTECFSPGDEHTEKEADKLYTKPEKLLKWIKLVLDAYHLNKQETVMDAARQLMTPQIIDRLLQLKVIVEDQFI